jgi:hypothetical protein
MNDPRDDTETRFAKIVRSLKNAPGVTVGTSKKKGFGSSALCIGEKIFAMVSSRGNFVVKLPRDRVDTLVAAEAGVRFGPGHGRVMKEWLAVDPKSREDWLALAKEALVFVSSKK